MKRYSIKPPRTPYRYGHSPNPRSWLEAVDALESNVGKKPKESSVSERLARIEHLLQSGKG